MLPDWAQALGVEYAFARTAFDGGGKVFWAHTLFPYYALLEQESNFAQSASALRNEGYGIDGNRHPFPAGLFGLSVSSGLD